MNVNFKEREEFGKCHFCQESTKLEIHQNCGRSRKRRASTMLKKKPRAMCKETEDFLVKVNENS